jgi:ABC-2 type transport system ATP-binding protein
VAAASAAEPGEDASVNPDPTGPGEPTVDSVPVVVQQTATEVSDSDAAAVETPVVPPATVGAEPEELSPTARPSAHDAEIPAAIDGRDEGSGGDGDIEPVVVDEAAVSSSTADDVASPPPALPPLPTISAAEAAVVFAQVPAPVAEVPETDANERSIGLVDRLKRLFRSRSTGAPAPHEAAPIDAAEAGSTDDARTPGPLIDAVSETADASVAAPAPEAEHDDDVVVEERPVSPLDEQRGDERAVDLGTVLAVRGLTKSFGETRAVDALDLDVHAGSFYGIVGPNGAGKTTTLSMITGLLRPDAGTVSVNGIDVWADPAAAKRTIGVLPDRLRVFDRLTGAQLLYYAGMLRGLKSDVVRSRVEDLARAFGLEDAMGRLVSDYSAGMVKKVSLAAAMIHSPRVLVLDEPFESVDPVSAARIVEILRTYVDNGGTVVLSSHSMDFIQRVCDHVAIIVEGQVLAAGAVEDVRGPVSLEERFLELAGGRKAAEGMEWLHSFSG